MVTKHSMHSVTYVFTLLHSKGPVTAQFQFHSRGKSGRNAKDDTNNNNSKSGTQLRFVGEGDNDEGLHAPEKKFGSEQSPVVVGSWLELKSKEMPARRDMKHTQQHRTSRASQLHLHPRQHTAPSHLAVQGAAPSPATPTIAINCERTHS